MTRANPKRKKARAGYMISAVAELYKLHLAGIEIILNMREKIAEMNSQMEAFTAFVRQELARGMRSASTRSQGNALARVAPPKVIRVHK
jgi:hypothetical protein